MATATPSATPGATAPASVLPEDLMDDLPAEPALVRAPKPAPRQAAPEADAAALPADAGPADGDILPEEAISALDTDTAADDTPPPWLSEMSADDAASAVEQALLAGRDVSLELAATAAGFGGTGGGEEGQHSFVRLGRVSESTTGVGFDFPRVETALPVAEERHLRDEAPQAIDDSATLGEDSGGIGGNVLGNDQVGGDGPAALVGWDSTTASYGTFTPHPDGSWTYVPDNAALQGLDAGETLVETFAYTMRDADGDQDSAVLTIVITGSNDAPTVTVATGNEGNADDLVYEAALPEGSTPGSNGEFAAGTLLLADPDGLDDLQAVTINGSTIALGSLVGTTIAGDHGTLTITGYADGVASYAYELTEATTDGPGPETDSFVITVSDGTAESAPATLTIQIVDDVPTALDDANGTASEDHLTLTGNVMANDTEGADGASVTPAVLQGTYGTLTLNADGSYSYTLDPTDPDFQALTGGGTGSEEFTYTLTDGDGDPDTAALTLAIENVDDRVLITDLTPKGEGGDALVDEDDLADGSDPLKESLTGSGSFTVEAHDGIADLSIDGHAIVTDGVFIATSFTTALGNTLSITGYNALTGVVSYEYTLGDNEAHATAAGQNSLFEDFNVSLTDSDGDNTTGTLSVNIVDDVPTAVNDSNSSASETNTVLSGNVMANDTEGADGASVTAGVFAGTYGSLELAADGSYTYTLDVTDPDFIALAGASANEVFEYTLTDGDGDTSTATLTLQISNEDDDVYLYDLNPKGEGGDALVDEDDLDDGSDTSKESLTTSGDFRIEAADGVDDLTVGGQAVISDGVFTATSFMTALGNTLNIYDYDPATGTVYYEYTLTDNEQHADANGQNSLFEDFAVVLTDTDGDEVDGTLSINIVDDVPTAEDDAHGTVTENNLSVSGNVLPNDTAGADGASVTPAVLQGTYGSLEIDADGNYTYTLDPDDPDFLALVGGQTATEVFTYTLTDGDGDSDTATLTIGLQNADDDVYLTDLTPKGEGGDAMVDEDDLAEGSDTSKESTTTSGTFTITAADGVDDLIVGGQTVISNGVFSATSFTTAMGNTLSITAYDPATGTVSYDYTLEDNEAHAAGSGENTLFEDIGVTVTDRDGDAASGTLSIAIVDDIASDISPEAGHVNNVAGASGTFALDTDGNTGDNIGADQPGSVRFSSAQEGLSSLTSLGNPIYFWVSPDGQTLTASTAASEADVSSSNTVFTVALNPDGSFADSNDSYTVTMVGSVDNGAGETFENLTGTGPAGNPDFKIVSSDPLSPDPSDLEILFTPAGGATSVNSDSDDVGVDSQFVNSGEGLRVDFGSFSINASDDFVIDSHRDINGFTFAINQIAGGSTASVVLKAFDANEDSNFGNDSPDPITRILVYSLAGLLIADSGVGDAGGIDFTDNGDGTWTVEGLKTGYSVTTLTADGYDRIEVYNADLNGSDGKFSMSHLEVLVTDAGAPLTQDFDLVVSDSDGDTAAGSISVDFEPAALAGNNTVTGTSGNDTLYGGAGNDSLRGLAGNDVLHGGSGDDRLEGGTGNDSLTGGLGADVFAWELGDHGSAGSPNVDTITDFSLADHDVLDLADLLVGEEADPLTDYLHFELVGADTVVSVSSSGAFDGSNYASTADLRIVLSGVDLVTGSSGDSDILNSLVTSSRLQTDA